MLRPIPIIERLPPKRDDSRRPEHPCHFLAQRRAVQADGPGHPAHAEFAARGDNIVQYLAGHRVGPTAGCTPCPDPLPERIQVLRCWFDFQLPAGDFQRPTSLPMASLRDHARLPETHFLPGS